MDDTDNPTQMPYNYPWVARLHLTMYQDSNDPRYLDAFVRTIRAFYRNGGGAFLSHWHAHRRWPGCPLEGWALRVNATEPHGSSK
jgi:hypothetical protein